MKIINCEQGTPEWYEARLGIPTASNFSKLVTSAGATSKTFSDYAFDLASQILVDEQDPPVSTWQMQRGTDLEPYARDEYQARVLALVEEVGFCRHDDDNCGYSPDGFVGDDGLVEFKCVNQVSLTKILYKNEMPTTYFQQVQGGLYVTDRKWCDFVVYHPEFTHGRDMFIKRIYRNEEFIKSLKLHIDKVIEKRDEILLKISSRQYY